MCCSQRSSRAFLLSKIGPGSPGVGPPLPRLSNHFLNSATILRTQHQDHLSHALACPSASELALGNTSEYLTAHILFCLFDVVAFSTIAESSAYLSACAGMK